MAELDNDDATLSRKTKYKSAHISGSRTGNAIRQRAKLSLSTNGVSSTGLCYCHREAADVPRSSEMGGIVANIRSATNDDQRIDPESIKSEKWICEECAFANNAQYLMVCSSCGTPKGGKAPSADAGWTCAVCTLINSEDRDRCAACSKSRKGAFWFAPDDVKSDSAPSARSAPSATSGSSSQPRKSSNAARAAPPANTKASPKKSRMNGGSDGHVLHYLDRRQSMLTGDVTWEVELSTALEKYRSVISFCRANREQVS